MPELCGVIHELLGETSGAMMCYGAAARADPDYEPAIRNFRRMYEIHMFGRSKDHLVIGQNR